MKPISPIDLIEKLPEDLVASLEADPFFDDIPVILADEGNVEAEIKSKQAVIKKKGGKTGIAVIVLQIIAADETPDLLSGPFALFPGAEVIEQRELNRNPETGTCKPCRRVCRRIIQNWKALAAEGLYTNIIPENPCIVPVPRGKDENPNVIRKQVNAKCYEADDDEQFAILPMPGFIQNQPGVFALTCSNANAQIFYTLDDSLPSPNRMSVDGKTKSFLFAPGDNIPVPPEGLFIRARTYWANQPKNGTVFLPSIVARAFIEPA